MDGDDIFEFLAIIFLSWKALAFIIAVLVILSLTGVLDWSWATE